LKGDKNMSELIKNREKTNENAEKRQEILKQIILQLHQGKDPKDVKEEFGKLINGVSAIEISNMESALIKDGMPVAEVQRLCDVHAEIFKGSIEEVHSATKEEEKPGHPVRVLKEENFAIEDLINNTILPKIKAYIENMVDPIRVSLIQDINLLLDIDKHYSRKENILFPYMEKYGISAPPKIMWGVDDEIRNEIKEFKTMLVADNLQVDRLELEVTTLTTKILDMVFKEENIMLPMLLDVLTEDEWFKIAEDSDEIGYSIVSPKGKWVPSRINTEDSIKSKEGTKSGYIKLETGILKVEELQNILNLLPFDITFIDSKDIVKYFSESKERIFPRTKSVIGRDVSNCHPPASVHVVTKLLDDFKTGIKDSEDFWISMKGIFILIRYFAVRDINGVYLGTLEVTQNIKPIQEITGEKRLLSE